MTGTPTGTPTLVKDVMIRRVLALRTGPPPRTSSRPCGCGGSAPGRPNPDPGLPDDTDRAVIP